MSPKSWHTNSLPRHAEKCGHSVLESQLEKEMRYFWLQIFYRILDRSENRAHKKPTADFSQKRMQSKDNPVVIHVIR